METRYLGEEIKVKIDIDPIGEECYKLGSEGVNWTAYLSCNPRQEVVIEKGDPEAIYMEEGNYYVLCLDTSNVGSGILKLKLVVEIPDGDFEDNKRTMIGTTKIVKIISDFT